jgi:hypothetical protein
LIAHIVPVRSWHKSITIATLIFIPQEPAFSVSDSKLNFIFSEQGPLAETISGFRSRQQQLEMALAIEEAIKNNAQLVAEAGTGTGFRLSHSSAPIWRQSHCLHRHKNLARSIV